MTWLDRAITWMSPSWGASRQRARLMARHFEAASVGRRTDGRHRLGSDANAAASGNALSILRAQARDLVRNNPWADNGLDTIAENTVGWGIQPIATGRSADRIMDLWAQWAETTQCDAAGRLTFYGLQALAMRCIAEAGEVIIRRRMRLPTDGLAVPMQLQILEPDFIDSSRDGFTGDTGGPVIQGIEFDMLGRRAAYWLFDQHPGGRIATASGLSRRITADGILHVFDQKRAGQVRGTSWFAPVDIRLRDFDEFEDATLMKQKVSALMAAFVTDLDGSAPAIGEAGTDSASGQLTDTLEPGMIISLPGTKQVTIANPPSSTDHQSFSATTLRGVAAGLGVTYEDLTNDFSQVNYSSARMARLAHQRKLHHWRWNMLIPQFCAPAWAWMLSALRLADEDIEVMPAQWMAPPMPILEPDKEGTAMQRLVRIGMKTWPQMISEQGENPKTQLAAIEAFNKELDRRGIALDCDPRRMTAAGGVQQVWSAGSIAPWPPKDEPAAAAGGAANPPASDDDDAEGDEAEGEESSDESTANGAAH